MRIPAVYRRMSKKAQSTLEVAVAIIGILILLLGSLKLFMWVNKLLVLRQESYENTRVSAVNAATEQAAQVDESGFPPLNLVGN